MSQSSSEATFSKWRGYLFPIHRHEFRKFLPMMAMLMLIVFNYTILRNMKESVIVTAAGAEVIPFIKVWVMLPCAVLVTLLFAKLTNRFSQEKVYYIMISGFLICYGLFGFVFYPLRDALHPHASSEVLMTWLPEGFKGLVNMYRYWTFTLFYVVSELWSSMIMTTLFWGLANEVYSVVEARRFYGVLAIAGNVAGIIAGEITVLVSDWATNRSNGVVAQDWELVMQYLILAVIAAGLVSMVIFNWMNRQVLAVPVYEQLHSSIDAIDHKKKKKRRLSLRESISYLSNSKYIICIAVVVVSYNLVINLVEVVWKDKVSQLYPASMDYNTYMAHITIATNIISTIAAFFISHILMACGWTRTALITPIIMLTTCAGFFGFLLVQDNIGSSFDLFGATPLAIAVFFGGAQNCLSRAAKFSVFDATKEMSFIPLDHESKLKGKAAIDGVGSRLGKSGGSIIHQGLLMFFSTLSAITPYVGVILMAVIVGWIVAVRVLGLQFNALVEKREQKDAQPEEEPASPALQQDLKPVNA